MIAEIKQRKTPEEEELNKKLAELGELESDLAEQELELATIHGELRAFEIRYLRIIGTRYAELDEIGAQIAELQARLKPKDKDSQERASQARVKAQESAQAFDVEQEPLKQERFTPSESLKKLYREVAKSVHPDLANDEEERVRRQRFMAEANKAYEEGDEVRLESILRKWGYINKKGGYFIEPTFDHASHFSEGFASVRREDMVGYIYRTGAVSLMADWVFAGDFSEGLANVLCYREHGLKWGYIGCIAEILITVIIPQFDDAGPFSEGLAKVKINDKWGFINKSGKIVIDNVFDDAFSFREGMAVVKIDDKYGYIDKRGTMVVEPQFDYCFDFSEGLGKIVIDSRFGYLDKTRNYIWKPTS